MLQRITQTSPEFRRLFDRNDPGSLRCAAVLDGKIIGEMWVDNPDQPTHGIVQESTFGTFFLGGQFDQEFLTTFIEEQKTVGDVLFGFWADNTALESRFPPAPYIGYVLEFDERIGDLAPLMQPIPADVELCAVDEKIFFQMQDGEFYAAMFGSMEKALAAGLGFCILHEGQIASEAFASMSADGLIEIGVNTQKAHWRKGYGTLVCAHTIQACEQRGYRTYWNCAEQNQPSAALARKLGYNNKRRYKLFAW